MTTTERTSLAPSRPDRPGAQPAAGTPGVARPMPGAKAPVAGGALPWVGIVLALLVTAVGVACLHDALRATGLISGPAWLDTSLTWAQAVRPASWMIPFALALVALGGWLLVVGMRPRRRSAHALHASTGVFLPLRDVNRLAVAAAGSVGGVTGARASTNRRRVAVDAVVTGSLDELRTQVADAVTDRLSVLDPAPLVTVRVHRSPERVS